jgi:cytidine deaminase
MNKLHQKLVDKAISVAKKVKLGNGCKSGDVGCALITGKGRIYTGVSIVADCGIGFCAEHGAIAAMITRGESRIISIVATDSTGRLLPPCGRCRELIFQVNNQNLGTEVILAGNKAVKLASLLPKRWQDIYFSQPK